MGYSIDIGEKVTYTEDGETYYDAQREEHPNTAPQFVGDELTGCSNNRNPSYTGWHNFTEATGLTDTFAKVFAEHPGVYPITPELLTEFRAANDRFAAAHPDVKPGFTDGTTESANAARLDWLIYWTAWALEHCEEPVIANG